MLRNRDTFSSVCVCMCVCVSVCVLCVCVCMCVCGCVALTKAVSCCIMYTLANKILLSWSLLQWLSAVHCLQAKDHYNNPLTLTSG